MVKSKGILVIEMEKMIEFEEDPKRGIGELPTEIVKEENLWTTRNQAIKKALKKYGYRNIRVRQGRGKLPGWVDIEVGEERQKIIDILKKEGLWEQIGKYEDGGVLKRAISIK